MTQNLPTLRESHALSAVGALTAVVLCTIFAFPYWPVGHAGNIYIALHFGLTAAMLVVWATPAIKLRHVLLLAVALRVALIPAAPISSNDVERYLWDGAVALSGFDPYTVAADDPLVADLRAIWPTPEEHAKYPTLYPPAALLTFALAALGGPEGGLILWKIITAMAGIASLFFIKAVLEHYGQERHFALFALSPLLLLETGVGAHLDALLVLGISAILYFHAKKRWGPLGIALGCSACVKFLPIALLGPLLFAVPMRSFLRALTSGILAIVTFYGAALALGYTPIGILGTFFEKWRFTSPVYELFEFAIGPSNILWALLGLAIVGVAIACLAARKNFILGSTIILCTPLLLSPVVYPWYLMSLVPLLAIRPSWALLGWVSLAPISYVVLNQWLAERIWDPASWPVLVLGAALSLGLLLDFLRVQEVPSDGKAKEQTGLPGSAVPQT